MRRRQRLVVVLVLTLGLAALPAAAAGPRDRNPSAWQGLAGLWAWITDWLPVQEAPDQGYVIDPNGSTAAPALPSSDQSWLIDPNG